MVEPHKPEMPEQISCEICLKEVPRTEAMNAEGSEYVLYFCGLDCYQKWSADKTATDAGGKPPAGRKA
jgi:ribosome-binding protein aMBF1 (putative translation factor)